MYVCLCVLSLLVVCSVLGSVTSALHMLTMYSTFVLYKALLGTYIYPEFLKHLLLIPYCKAVGCCCADF